MLSGLRESYRIHPARFEIGFFIAGFLWDVITLDQIDSLWSIAQQAVFLAIGYAILAIAFGIELGRVSLGPRAARAWRYHDLAFQFVIGSLLSGYTLFFFKSASLASSFVFMGLLVAVLLVNEFVKTERFEFWMRSTILSLCLVCFFIYLVPIGFGVVGTFTFFASLVVASGFFAALHLGLKRWLGASPAEMGSKWRVPFIATLVVMGALYSLRLIPPIPLSLESMGIYHKVEKKAGAYTLTYYRDWWRFWESGAQSFTRKPDERVYAFFSVFSPVRFSDRVYVRWWQRDPRAGWMPTDRIPIAIQGGRDEGFRGFAYKTNVTDGDWRITVETDDERELGRIGFEVTTHPEPERDEPKISHQ